MTDHVARIRHELTLPPDATTTPADLDEDTHPTSAWLLGERLDDETVQRLQAIVE